MSSSAVMGEVFDKLRRLEDVCVRAILLSGESGTGKELVARTIHQRGKRRDAPFVEVDCTVLPQNLVESTLFGHERGSFTGASSTREGLLEAAGGGVVFLDEVGELPLDAQAKLLRALENRTFKRVGGTRNFDLRASVIAATNRDLRQEVAEGRFREDLYYRLAVVPIVLPSLRERTADIPLLLDRFLGLFRDQFERDTLGFEPGVLERLVDYHWPGNVRELRNLVEQLLVFAEGSWISEDDLPQRFLSNDSPCEAETAGFVLPAEGVDLARLERSLVRQALARTRGCKGEAARLLGISRFVLRNRINRYGLEEDETQADSEPEARAGLAG